MSRRPGDRSRRVSIEPHQARQSPGDLGFLIAFLLPLSLGNQDANIKAGVVRHRPLCSTWKRKLSLSRRVRQGDVRVRGFGERQVDQHNGAETFLALDAERAAVELCKRTSDGKAKA